jgi:hypothetical protein
MALQWLTTTGQTLNINFHRDQIPTIVLTDPLVPEINGQCDVQMTRI